MAEWKEYIAWFSQGKHGESTMPMQELVRCRDCKHVMVFKINGQFVGACCTLHEDNNDVTGEDYCSKGTRRE